MLKIKASEFKAKCLHLMDLVNEKQEEIIITKNGKPVSKLIPYQTRPSTLFGLHRHHIQYSDDLIESVDQQWDANL